MDALLENITLQLDDGANEIRTRIIQVIELLDQDIFERALREDLVRILEPYIAKNWEYEHRQGDLGEEITNLRQELRARVLRVDEITPEPSTLLEIAQYREIQRLRERVTVLETRAVEAEPRLQRVTNSLVQVASREWELSYRCRDMSSEIWRLKEQLRTSVAAEDQMAPTMKPKTALEKALEKKVEELERKTARSRTNSIEARYYHT